MNEHLVSVISDTHGLLRPEAVKALEGAELIVHAGDVGSSEVLERLRQIAPVFAVRGNIDKGEWARELPQTQIVEVGGASLYVLHDLHKLDLHPEVAQMQAVIYGHSHRPSTETRKGVLYLNPGSAGPRRFNLPVSVALLRVGEGALHAELIELKVREHAP